MKSVTIKEIKLHIVALPLVELLKTSFGAEPFKTAIIVEAIGEGGLTGWGETALKTKPSYGAETVLTALHVTRDFLIPELVGQTLRSPTEVPAMFKTVRGNHHARAGLEAAIWDLLAKANGMRLADYFAAHLPAGNAPRESAQVGVSIGIQDTLDAQLALIQKRLDEGYGRIKLKIAPGWDLELARAVRDRFPDILLMLDANSAYTLNDAERLKALDQFDLLMIEQPLAYDDIYEHSQLQPHLKTPICLDESITSAHDWRIALRLGAGRILNLKPTRVGGYTESLEIYQLCQQNATPLWIGGMLETGIGRAANLAFAALPAVDLPSDISATSRYFDPDITEPPFELAPGSTIRLPEGPGIGVEAQRERLAEAESRWREHNPFAPLWS
ncbi:MAG: o-succinylbenzoate synthase [Chloroflexi bacterium]|nr:o-succinylbenzoate synthase [Chloroflexota bacterium]